ncbi:DUF4817 domain-containing protein [Trichonephila clavipes]|nr:DUF4817 domain-containing protein [Trichonephila clavipes]
MHCIYGRANGNSRAILRMCHVQFPDLKMPHLRIFQQSHRQLRETRSFHVTRHDADRLRPVRNPSLAETLLNFVDDIPESSTIAVAHQVSVSHQIVCRVLNENRLHLFHFRRVQALNPADFLLRLTVGSIAICVAVGLHNSRAE